PLRYRAGKDVRRSGRGERHDEPNGMVGIRRLRTCIHGEQRSECARERCDHLAKHEPPPWLSSPRMRWPSSVGSAQSTFAPEAFTMRAYFGTSAAMKRAN